MALVAAAYVGGAWLLLFGSLKVLPSLSLFLSSFLYRPYFVVSLLLVLQSHTQSLSLKRIQYLTPSLPTQDHGSPRPSLSHLLLPLLSLTSLRLLLPSPSLFLFVAHYTLQPHRTDACHTHASELCVL